MRRSIYFLLFATSLTFLCYGCGSPDPDPTNNPSGGTTNNTQTDTQSVTREQLYSKLKEKIPLIETRVTSSGTLTDSNGIYTLVIPDAGKRGNEQDSALRYIDFDTNKLLPLSDKEALVTDNDWELGIRSWLVITRGKVYGGDVSVARVQGSKTEFEAFTLAKAQQIPATDFVMDAPLDTTGAVSFLKPGGIELYKQLSSAFGVLNEKDTGLLSNSPFNYSGVHHTAVLKDDRQIYILKKGENTFIKFRFEAINWDSSNDKYTFTVQYQMLK